MPAASLLDKLVPGFRAADRLLGRVEGRASGLDLDFWKTLRSRSTDVLDDPYRNHAWVYACISAKARAVGSVPLQLVGGDDTNPAVVDEHPLIELLEAPNPDLTFSLLVNLTMTNLDNVGGCYWWLRMRDGHRRTQSEIPDEIHPYPITAFALKRRPDGAPAAYSYRDDGVEKYLTLDEVLAFRYPDPSNPAKAMSPLAAVRDGLELDSMAVRFAKAAFKNMGEIGTIFSTDQVLTDEQWTAISSRLKDRHEGVDKVRRIAVLEGGIRAATNVMSHQDMEFLEQRKWTREEILAVFGLHKMDIGLFEDVNFATAEVSDYQTWEKTLIPVLLYVEDVLYQDFFRLLAPPRKGAYQLVWGKFDFSKIRALQAGLQGQSETAKNFHAMGVPFDMINERMRLGFPKVPGGAVGYLPVTLIPTLFGGVPSAPARARALAASAPKLGLPAPVLATPRWAVVADKQARSDTIIREVMEPAERAFARVVVAWLAAWGEEVTKRVRDLDLRTAPAAGARVRLTDAEIAAKVALILEDRQAWADLLAAHLRTVYQDTILAALADYVEENGGSLFLPADPAVAAFLDVRANMLRNVTDTAFDAMNASLAEGLAASETVTELAARVQERLAVDYARASTIARTETATATNWLRQVAFQADDVEWTEWVTARDDVVRPTHAANEGLVRKLGDTFPNGLRWPNDPVGDPGEVVNCFPAGTPVLTDHGEKAIEDVVVGDRVLTHRRRYRPVVRLARSPEARSLVRIGLRSGRTFRVTPAHKLYVVGQGWVEAGALQRGDKLVDQVALAAVNDAVGEVEHPHPECLQSGVTMGSQQALASVDLYPGAVVRQEQVDVVVHAPSEAQALPRRALRRNLVPDLRDHADAIGPQPGVHDDLARRTGATVRELAASVLDVGHLLGGSNPPLVRPEPLCRDRSGAPTDRDTVEVEDLAERSSLGEAELCHEVAEARDLVGVTSAQVGHERLAQPSLPSAHGVAKHPVVGAALRAEAGLADPASMESKLDAAHLAGPARQISHEIPSNRDASMHLNSSIIASVLKLEAAETVFNFAVAEDMSYFAAGVLSRNCRCIAVSADAPPPDSEEFHQ